MADYEGAVMGGILFFCCIPWFIALYCFVSFYVHTKIFTGNYFHYAHSASVWKYILIETFVLCMVFWMSI